MSDEDHLDDMDDLDDADWDGQVPIEIRVRWEIWESFVSLLRSYAATAGTDYTVQAFSDWAKVGYKDRAVRFCFRPDTGEAIWRTVRPGREAWGSFRINPDGTFGFPDGPQQLDMAVIDWISWLGREKLFDRVILNSPLSDLPRSDDNPEPKP